MASRPFTFDRVVRLVITVVVILTALWLINLLRDVLLPFCVACLIAYMFEPFVQFNRRLLNLKGRVIAIFVTLFETTFFFGVLCYFCIPMLLDEFEQMAKLIQNYATSELDIPYIPQAVHSFIRKNIDLRKLSDILSTVDWASAIEETLRTTWNVVSGSISFLISAFSWAIVFVYVLFIMIDYDRLVALCRNLVPPAYRKTVFKISNDIKNSMNHYFRGQALVAFIVGVLFSIGFYIIDMPLAILMGMFIGLLNMVPYLQLISFIPTTLICLVYSVGTGVSFWTMFGEAFAVYCVVQVIQDMILTPKIMGKAMGLNPAIILLSLSVWGSLLGMLGLIIALPLTTLLLAYYNEYVIDRTTPEARRRRREMLANVEDFPKDLK